MKLLKKLSGIKEVRRYLRKNTGKIGQKIILIYAKKNRPVKDEYLAKKLKKKVTDIRSALNTLHYLGISHYQKEKNKNTGWYSFTWKINEKRVLELIKNDFKEKIEELEKRKEKNETYTMFGCQKMCEDLPFEVAAEYQFICPNCGDHMNVINSENTLKEIKKEIKKLRKTIQKTEELTKKKSTKNRTRKEAKTKKEKEGKQGAKTKRKRETRGKRKKRVKRSLKR